LSCLPRDLAPHHPAQDHWAFAIAQTGTPVLITEWGGWDTPNSAAIPPGQGSTSSGGSLYFTTSDTAWQVCRSTSARLLACVKPPPPRAYTATSALAPRLHQTTSASIAITLTTVLTRVRGDERGMPPPFTIPGP
jgi:hypothetical protein